MRVIQGWGHSGLSLATDVQRCPFPVPRHLRSSSPPLFASPVRSSRFCQVANASYESEERNLSEQCDHHAATISSNFSAHNTCLPSLKSNGLPSRNDRTAESELDAYLFRIRNRSGYGVALVRNICSNATDSSQYDG
jgi:hypothetical protein